MGKFKPKMYYKNIFDINYEALKNGNIKVLIFDLDNTIMTYDEKEPAEKVIKLFKKLSNDFQVFIASNNMKEKVKKIGNILNVHGFYSTLKPTKRLKKLLSNKINVKMEEVAIIGDQIVTDIFMGNRLHMKTILVDPLGEKDFKITFFNRWLEGKIMKRIKVKRGEYYEEIL